MRVPRKAVAALVALAVLLPLSLGCELLGVGNPTPGAKPASISGVWVRHLKDKHDREASALVGFTLVDRSRQPVAADGELKVELKWDAAMHQWTASGSADVRAGRFRRAEGKPVKDGTWYVEPWSIYLIGGQYPGPSKHGYQVSLTFTSEEGRKLTWNQWVRVTR